MKIPAETTLTPDTILTVFTGSSWLAGAKNPAAPGGTETRRLDCKITMTHDRHLLKAALSGFST